VRHECPAKNELLTDSKRHSQKEMTSQNKNKESIKGLMSSSTAYAIRLDLHDRPDHLARHARLDRLDRHARNPLHRIALYLLVSLRFAS
jgi:hypothetical protein